MCICLCSFGNAKTFTIYGTMKGEFKDKIFLFFENDIAHRDSIKTSIDKNGKFYFRLQNKLPILCRIYCGDKSSILEFYVDSINTYLTIKSTLTEKDTPDSLGGARTHLSLELIKGSKLQNVIESFEHWFNELNTKNLDKQSLHDKYLEELTKQVKYNRKNKASLYLIAGRIYFLGPGFLFPNNLLLSSSEMETLIKLTDASLNNTLEFQNIQKVIEIVKSSSNRMTGLQFYDVSFPDSTNKIISTKSFRGKYVLIDVWASWCKPCRGAIPGLKSLYETYKDKGFEILGISIDENKEAWKKALVEEQMKWTQLVDTIGVEGSFCKYYDIRAVPTQILLNKEGQVIAFPNNLSLEAILKQIFGE